MIEESDESSSGSEMSDDASDDADPAGLGNMMSKGISVYFQIL